MTKALVLCCHLSTAFICLHLLCCHFHLVLCCHFLPKDLTVACIESYSLTKLPTASESRSFLLDTSLRAVLLLWHGASDFTLSCVARVDASSYGTYTKARKNLHRRHAGRTGTTCTAAAASLCYCGWSRTRLSHLLASCPTQRSTSKTGCASFCSCFYS